MRDVAPEDPTPVGEACFHVLLDSVKIAGGHRLEAFEPGHLRLQSPSPTLPHLYPFKERLEVTTLGDRHGEAGEFLLQNPELRLEGGTAWDHGVRGGVQLVDGPAHGAVKNLRVQYLSLDRIQDRVVSQLHREDHASGTDRIPAQVVVAAQIRVRTAPAGGSAVHDEAAATPATLGESGQEVAGLNAVGRAAPELAVGRPEV